MEYEVEGPRPRGRPKRTWREVVEKDCQACKINTDDAVDRSRWRKLIKCVRWSGWVWVGEWVSSFWYRPTQVVPDQRPLNGCVCMCVSYPRRFRDVDNVSVWYVTYHKVCASASMFSASWQRSDVHNCLWLGALRWAGGTDPADIRRLARQRSWCRRGFRWRWWRQHLRVNYRQPDVWS